MTLPPPSDPTPGFHPDSQGAMRLWDGQRWTEVTRPMPQPATPPPGQPGYYPDAHGVMRWWTGRDWAPHSQPAATAQPEPKKSWKRKLGWLPLTVVLGVASCGVIVTAMDSSDDSSDTSAEPMPAAVSQAPSPKEPEEEASQVPTVGVGEKVRDDGYQFTVTEIRCGVKRVGGEYLNEKAQGQFCLVSLRVKNVSKEPINYSSENQALVDRKGREYSPDDEAWLYVDDSDPYGEINPGNTLKTTVPFDVSKKAKPDYLLLKAGFWGFSEGVRVKL